MAKAKATTPKKAATTRKSAVKKAAAKKSTVKKAAAKKTATAKPTRTAASAGKSATGAKKPAASAKKPAARKSSTRKPREVLPKQAVGDKLVKVEQFQVVLNPGPEASVAIFWNVRTKSEENSISSVTAEFAESLNGVVVRSYAGTTAQGFSHASTGSLSTNPHAFHDDPDKTFEAILSGTVLTPEGYQMFFFTKPVVLDQPEFEAT